MATFIVTTGKLKGHKVQINEPEVFVGRDETCKIRIASKEVSREHCVIMKQGKDILVRDLSSRNGTFVNGIVINGVTLLNPGDTLHIGPMIFELAGAKKTVAAGNRASAGNIRADRTPTASDHEIADWLSDSGESMMAGNEVAGDTHYANHSQQIAVAPAPAAVANQLTSSDIDEATRLVPSVITANDETVATRMASIVQNYWQKKA